MIDQRQTLIRDDRFELIFGGSGARHIGGAGFGRNVVPPVPAQGVIINRIFASSSLDRGTGRQKPLDPHTFRMITALASACGRPTSSRHYFPTIIHRNQIQLNGVGTPQKQYIYSANLRSGNHKTAFVVKPAENLAFPHKTLRLNRNSPGH